MYFASRKVDFPRCSLLDIIFKINVVHNLIFKTVEECQTIEISMTGAAATAKGFVQGTYSKTAKENGKLTWTKGSHALWFSTNGLWIVGNTGSVGGSSGFIFARLGLPYSSLINQWEYYNGNDWVKPINEITVQCTSLETVGKYISSKIEKKELCSFVLIC